MSVRLSVCPSKLSYLKYYVFEFGVNHSKDGLRCKNLIEMRGPECFPMIEN